MIKIISGGQTGVDLAALDAAKNNHLETGGWMPRNWQNLDGRHPEFAAKYGMKEHKNVGYAPRTKQNVVDSDGTIIIATNLGSSGTRLTMSTAKMFRKELYIVDFNTDSNEISDWIIDKKWSVINIAGNSETTSPGIYYLSYSILDRVFCQLKNKP